MTTNLQEVAGGGKTVSPKTELSFYRYRYLMGAMPQIQLTMTIRLTCIPEDVNRIPEIVQAWRGASARMLELANQEAGAAERVVVEDAPAGIRARLEEIGVDPLFRASFSDMPASFNVVELDKIVAPQREVNLDYVDSLRSRIPGKSVEKLVEFCIGPRTEPPELKALQTGQNQMTFSSRSLDLRFLGGFPKPIGEDDIHVAHMGGQPVEVVTLLIGFGAAPINAWMVGQRLVLANGFHRVVALRSEGITQAPIVVRRVANPEIEFPEQFLGLSRAYLLQQPRPVLVKDFFDTTLTVELKLKPRRRMVKVSWGHEDGVVPE
jgi:hypothetical protein